MNNKKKPLPKNLEKSLDELSEAEEMSKKMFPTPEPRTLWPDKKRVEKVKTQIGDDVWEMSVDHKVSGELDSEIVDLKVKLGFDLNINTLMKEAGDVMVKKTDPISETLGNSNGFDDELSQLVIDSLTPRSFGVSKKIEVKHFNSASDTKKAINETKGKMGVLIMYLKELLVHFDYAQMVEAVMMGKYVVDPKLFGSKLWVPVDSFQKEEEFSLSRSWADGGLTHEVMAKFFPKD